MPQTFGDNWRHLLQLEHILPAKPFGNDVPVYVDGKGTCPRKTLAGYPALPIFFRQENISGNNIQRVDYIPSARMGIMDDTSMSKGGIRNWLTCSKWLIKANLN
ncbi:MAG: IS1096 element passenger TnpR family protein [Bacillota bacterium]